MEQILQELEHYAREKYIPVLKDESTQFLVDFVKKHQPNNILEIGTAVGYSGSLMLLANTNSNLTTYRTLCFTSINIVPKKIWCYKYYSQSTGQKQFKIVVLVV